ncbi:G-protein coupled receptor 39 isoform X2 [Oenanthe melanoleuca]|uniref:G-protein coupled receptor 39 isoform X2 n=1 Tax=Oenanthe melanoleuca TaxID=2939378 RepID=UPI0024C13FDD|nr:G-protein coupled receptor 39 isoform X2 [Oenanthe melanoleuca]
MAGETPASDCSHLIDHSHVQEFEVALGVKITLALIYICIFVAGLLGNSITIKVTRILQKKGYLQKEVTDHMVSLACSDLLVILLGMPVEFFSAIWSPFSTPKGNLACKLYSFLFEACSYATVLHVASLSLERYVAVCHPFRFKALARARTVKLLIAFVWGTSVLVALPLLFAMGTEYPLEAIEGYQRASSCVKPTPRHYIPELKHNMTICTNLSSRTDRCDAGAVLDAEPGQTDHGCCEAKAGLDQALLQGLHHPAPHRRHLLLPQLGGEPAAVQHLVAAVPQRVPAGAELPPVPAARQQGAAPPGHPEPPGAPQPLPAPAALRILPPRLFHQGQRQSFPEHLPEGAHGRLQPRGAGSCPSRSQRGRGDPGDWLRARARHTERPL